jgi:bifunctional non-homologous end joining protein LigD
MRVRGESGAAAGPVPPAAGLRVDMAGWFPEPAGLAGALGGHDGVLDGEVVAVDADGRPNFGALQRRLAARGGRRRGTAVT